MLCIHCQKIITCKTFRDTSYICSMLCTMKSVTYQNNCSLTMRQRKFTPSFEHVLKSHFCHLSSTHLVTRFYLSEFCLLCLLKIDESLYEGETQLSIEAASLTKYMIRNMSTKQTETNPMETISKAVRKIDG